MKNATKLLYLILFCILFISCSSDPESDPVVVKPPVPEIPKPVPVVDSKITAYSSNYGKTDEEITITGENFSDKIENINLYFDNVKATIISATSTQIKFKLPTTTNVVPVLRLEITNTKITNLVKNAYKGNIAILKANPASSWIVSNSATNNSQVIKIQILDNGAVYYNWETSILLEGGSTISYNYVNRSLDDGKTWENWTETASTRWATNFFATNSDEGWSVYSEGSLYKIPMGGLDRTQLLTSVGSIVHMNADESLKSGSVITSGGNVHSTNDGANFSKVYSSTIGNNGGITGSTFLDNDHIWAYGLKGFTIAGTFGYKPILLYKKGSSDEWKEKVFSDATTDARIRSVQFFKDNSGLMLFSTLNKTSILKSVDGGDNWSEIYSGEAFNRITFNDANNGWAVLGKIIYKTTNGGVSWTVDYTHEEDILNIAARDKTVWAFSKSKILKRYL